MAPSAPGVQGQLLSPAVGGGRGGCCCLGTRGPGMEATEGQYWGCIWLIRNQIPYIFFKAENLKKKKKASPE